jgi:hypothetical protein
MSVVLGNGSAAELMFGLSGLALIEQPLTSNETQAINMIRDVLTLHLLLLGKADKQKGAVPQMHVNSSNAGYDFTHFNVHVLD